MVKSPLEEEAVDLSRVSYELPIDIKIGIADLILAFSKLEQTCQRVVWGVHNLSPDDGDMLIGRVDARKTFELLEQSLMHKAPSDFAEIPKRLWETFRLLTRLRNLAAHGAWVVVDGHDIQVISSRLKAKRGFVTGERFPLSRLHTAIRWTARAQAAMADLAAQHAPLEESG